MSFRTLAASNFTFTRRLQELWLIKCGIGTIAEDAFHLIGRTLETIYLSGNSLHSICFATCSNRNHRWSFSIWAMELELLMLPLSHDIGYYSTCQPSDEFVQIGKSMLQRFVTPILLQSRKIHMLFIDSDGIRNAGKCLTKGLQANYKFSNINFQNINKNTNLG